jgi:2-oxo-3-hexenedioate decarboxylase
MSATTAVIDEAAERLLAAETERRDIDPLTDEWPDLDLATAYAIQDAALERRVDRGESVVGIKLGLTSVAKQQRMGIDSPLTAWLTDAMVLPAGVPVPQDRLIHPRGEPEILFVMERDLSGPGVTAPHALAAVGAIHSAVEVIDSRYRDFRFTLPDVVADNASTAALVTGPVARRPHELDLTLEPCLVEVDGAVVDSATGAAVQGHPAEALALAANALSARGHRIETGWIVLTGGMTDAVDVSPGSRLTFTFGNLGTIHLNGGGTDAAG